MVTIKDTTLIKSFNEGDPMAFKVIFDRYYKILCSYTYHFIRTPYAVDDIVQDIFVALWNRREKFDCIEKISSFLFVSTRNACFNHAKHEQMKAAKLKEFVAQTDEAVYDDYIIMAEFDQKLNHWLESLPTECRKNIDMSVSGMKNDEIAKALNISINTVKLTPLWFLLIYLLIIFNLTIQTKKPLFILIKHSNNLQKNKSRIVR